MGLMADLGNSIIGRTEKAILVLHDKDADEIISKKVKSEVAKSTASALKKGLSASGIKAGSDSRILRVQYNPASLGLQVNAYDTMFVNLQSHLDAGALNQASRPPLAVLQVQLVFDAMNKQDAFMFEKFQLSLGNIASDIAGAFKNYSVLPQTNALIAAHLNQSTRTVTFRWADMAFTGQIFEAEAAYTMFSVSGEPVRSVVRIRIAQQVESEGDKAYWGGAMEKVFDKGRGLGQKMGNLLNTGNF